MRIAKQVQLTEIGDEVLALTSACQPILKGLLYGLKKDIVGEAGGYDNLKLKMLPRCYREGSGDIGICFEYAVHEAVKQGDGRVIEKLHDASKLCKIDGKIPNSILFGLEKEGALNLIATANDILTDESLLLYGRRGRPAK